MAASTIRDPTTTPARARLPWRMTAGVASVVAFAVLALVLAHWGWRIFGPAPDLAPRPAEPSQIADAIAAANLFGRAPAAASGTAASPGTASSEMRLIGVFAEPAGAGFALFQLPDRSAILVEAGTSVRADVVVEEVRANGVRLRDHGEIRELGLRTAQRAPAPAAARAPTPTALASAPAYRSPCVAPPGFAGIVLRLNAELLVGMANDPRQWNALLAPAAGALVVRDGEGLAKLLGMREGDRVTQANGIALASIDDVQVAVLRPLLASQPVRVQGTRGGKPVEWMFVNNGACPA